MDPREDEALERDAAVERQPGREDEFRRRLKTLGYLDNPLDRFFIGGAHGRGGVLAANLKIAAKVGVLGGVFLGVVTAIGLELLSGDGLGGFAPAAKLAAYFSIIFTALFAALELVICLVVTALGRTFRRLFTRTEMIALYSGIFAALLILVYGTLWWWAGDPQASLRSPRSLVVFAVIAGLAVGGALLTRIAVTALLALLGGADLAARGKGRATKLYFVVLLLSIVIFAGSRLAARPAPERPSPYDWQPTGISVTLVAIDGGTADFLDRVCRKEYGRNLARSFLTGFVAPLSDPGLHVNPSVWTTVATGVGPDKHGVTSYGGQEIAGLGLYMKDRVGFGLYDALLAAGLSRRAPLERRLVMYPAIWDVLAGKGALSGVVNWWGSWPADSFHGFLVTDRMYPKLQVSAATGKEPAFEVEVYPRSLFNLLARYQLTVAKMSDDPLGATEDMDRFAVSAFLEGLAGYPTLSFSAVYLPGLDVYENSLWGQGAGRLTTAKATDIAEGAIKYWEFLDGLLEPVLRRAGPSDVVMVVSDPGMPKDGEPTFGSRGERGFILVTGGPVKAGHPDAELRLADVAPTILYLLGFPRSREMDGRAALELFDEDYVEAHPPREVDTFGRLKAKAAGKYSVDSALVERLKSLGYLE